MDNQSNKTQQTKILINPTENLFHENSKLVIKRSKNLRMTNKGVTKRGYPTHWQNKGGVFTLIRAHPSTHPDIRECQVKKSRKP